MKSARMELGPSASVCPTDRTVRHATNLGPLLHVGVVVRRVLRRWHSIFMLLAMAVWCPPLEATPASSQRRSKGASTDSKRSLAPTANSSLPTFAPVPADHPLAGLWNDPEMTQRLWGSYGFLSDREPRLTTEEQAFYRNTILPLLREDPKNALSRLEAAVKPTDSALFDYTLATVYFQCEDFTNAIRYYEMALAKFPDFLRAQRNLALALVRTGRYAEAIPALTRTLSLGGIDGRIYGLLAYAHTQEGEYFSAASAYQQALLFEPTNKDYQLGLVQCLITTARYNEALRLLDELLIRSPDSEMLWALQANIYLLQNQLGRAAASYEILRRLGKAKAEHLSILGDIYLAEGIPDLALSAYLDASQRDGDTNLSRTLRAADLLASRGAWDEARQLLDRARTLADSMSDRDNELELKRLRLQARVAQGQGQWAMAIQILEELLQRNPLDGEALLLAGDYHLRHGDPQRAAFCFDTAAKIEGFEAVALVKHAQLLVDTQQYPRAIELLRRAQKIQPRDNVQRYLERVEQVAARARGGEALSVFPQ